MQQKQLLAIVEQGGYPDYREFYNQCGYEVTLVHAMRKAMSGIKKNPPDVIVAEFNYQSDFRDRTSSLESLLATVEQITKTKLTTSINVIIFYEKDQQVYLEKLKTVFSNFQTIAFPIDQNKLKSLLD